MSFVRKFNGKTERADNPSPIVACYTCPEHGEFDHEVERDGRGEAPDIIACPIEMDEREDDDGELRAGCFKCGLLCTWTPTPVAGRVRRFEVVRGGWEKPERPTYLDTRKLGEGQSMEEFREERKAVWERKRQEDRKRFKEGM